MRTFSIPPNWIEAFGVVYAATFGGSISAYFRHWRSSHTIAREPLVALVVALFLPILVAAVPWHQPGVVDASKWLSAWVLGTLFLGWGVYRLSRVELQSQATRAAIDAISEGVIVTDARLRVILTNASTCRMLRRDGAQLRGLELRELLPQMSDASFFRHRTSTLVELVLDGDVSSWLEVTTCPIRSRRGRTQGHVIVLWDVTRLRQSEREQQKSQSELLRKLSERTVALYREVDKRKGTEAALTKSARLFRAVFDQASQLIWLTDPAGNLLDANRSALRTINASVDDVVGHPFTETPWWRNATEETSRLRTALAAAGQGVFVRYEAVITASDEEARPIDLSFSPVRDDLGNVVFIVTEGRDMSELKRSEQERRTLVTQLNQAQRLDVLGRLAGGVAQDFDGLIATVVGNLSRLEGISSPVAVQFDLNGTLEATRRAGDLMRQLLTFSRRQLAEPRVFRPAESLDAIREVLPRVVGEEISLKVTITGDPGPVFMDPSQFEQTLMCLVVNARDAMPSGGQLDVTLSRIELDDLRALPQGLAQPGIYVLLTVSDTGAGIPDSIIQHLFEPFFTTKAPGAGTGLGLAMAHGVVTEAQGAIVVDSRMGWGTTFRVYLPSCAEDSESPSLERDEASTSSFARVLVIEDQDSVRDLIVRALRRHHFEVVAHADGRSALEYVRHAEHSVDVVLTDVVMPQMDGRALADAMRRILPKVPIVFMSGHTDDEVLRHGIRESLEYFLAKPFTPQTLASKLGAILESSSRTSKPK